MLTMSGTPRNDNLKFALNGGINLFSEVKTFYKNMAGSVKNLPVFRYLNPAPAEDPQRG